MADDKPAEPQGVPESAGKLAVPNTSRVAGVMAPRRRLVLAMVFLVVATTCGLSVFTHHFVTEAVMARAPDQLAAKAALGTAELKAALAGVAVAMLLAVVLAIWIARSLLKSLGRDAGSDSGERAQRMQAHQALVYGEQMAQAIVKTALDAFIQTDEKGVVLDWSPQAQGLTGWTRTEAVGNKVEDLIVPEALRDTHRARIERFLSEVSGGPMGMRYETPSIDRQGHEFLVEVSLTALRRGDGYVINAFARDITQKRIAEEQLIQAQKMESVGQLTAGIAHDFNNMLTVITGTIEILADAVKADPNLVLVTTLMSEAADRGARLTSSLLAFARKQALQPAVIDINELITETFRLLSATLGKQIEIETTLSGDVWPAFVDRAQLGSALVNLAINARDAMPDGGKLNLTTSNVKFGVREAVAVGVERAGDYVAIAIRDTGAGIPPGIRDKVFDPFFSTKQMGKGTGLGLSTVFGFVKQSGGSIEVRSEEGRGTTFSIYLPKADMSALQPLAEDGRSARGGNETILCVEDDGEVRDYLTIQLKSLGYKVIVAADAAEALAISSEGAEFDLLFTDIVMPGNINGRQLAEAMMARRPSLRVLFTSGYAFGAVRAQGRAGHGIPILAKPYRQAELARMLRRCLDPPVDPAGDLIPLPYSVQPELERFLRMNPLSEQ
jgi:PAS domain S-box-containing protein